MSEPGPIRLLADPSRCLFTGGGARPTYLELRDCSGGTGHRHLDAAGPEPLALSQPLTLSFRSTHAAGSGRNSDVLTTGDGSGTSTCMDADGMTADLQLYPCIADDDDQQYAAVDGYVCVALHPPRFLVNHRLRRRAD